MIFNSCSVVSSCLTKLCFRPLCKVRYAGVVSLGGQHVVLDNSLQKEVDSGELKARHHPGKRKNRVVEVPRDLERSILKVLSRQQSLKQLKDMAARLSAYLDKRRPPVTTEQLYNLRQKAVTVAMRKYNRAKEEAAAAEQSGDSNGKEGDEKAIGTELEGEPENFEKIHVEKAKLKIQRHVDFLMKGYVFHWEPLPTATEFQCLVYLISRFSVNYAATHTVLAEIVYSQPDFRPKSVFDFGSGVGTVFWACESVWPTFVEEYVCVDTSASMNELARALVCRGNENEMPCHRNVVFRQFLPASNDRLYDVVVSAFSLMELTSDETRNKVLESLWNKTARFLVIIEDGSNAGFRLIIEARKFILDKIDGNETAVASSADQEVEEAPAAAGGRLLAPCPHALKCPRLQDKTPCNFPVRYSGFRMPGDSEALREKLFSYVVFDKDADFKTSASPSWPRVVRQPILRHKHVHCELCTAAGTLKRVVFTRRQNGSFVYQAVRRSNYGDTLPVEVVE